VEELELIGISVKLPADKHEQFKKVADESGISMASLIRNMIYTRIDEHEAKKD